MTAIFLVACQVYLYINILFRTGFSKGKIRNCRNLLGYENHQIEWNKRSENGLRTNYKAVSLGADLFKEFSTLSGCCDS